LKKRIAILGSTGSIGSQTLEVIGNHPGKFELEVLTAGNNAERLVEQSRKFLPNHVVIANPERYDFVKSSLSDLPVKVYSGFESIAQIVEMDSIDMVVTAMVGFSGLIPTLKAIQSGKDIALANKETLVVAGDLVMKAALEYRVAIYPVDSEHSAIFQSLVGERRNPIEKIFLTASGGPFLGWDRKALEKVTREEALRHPNWCMGDKVTIDSATLMNKGLEVIEARWLFGLKPGQIDVIVHPQSIIHSIVQFEDGSMKAQMGIPDMKLPIQYALGYPDRLKSDLPRFNFADYPELSFQLPDTELFENLGLAYEALRKGGNMPCILNAANEVAVKAFLQDRLAFLNIPGVIIKTMEKAEFIGLPDLEEYIESDSQARSIAGELVFR
jgi:1-deoxy-D-xylulose-5-phosphate reductoisomerase